MAELRAQVKPESLRSFTKACDRAEKDTDTKVKDALKTAGQLVHAGAAWRTFPKHALTAAGYRSRVRSSSVVVEQRLPKTTRLHPEWGSWQMKHALLPALYSNLRRINHEFEQATDKVCDRFEAT